MDCLQALIQQPIGQELQVDLFKLDFDSLAFKAKLQNLSKLCFNWMYTFDHHSQIIKFNWNCYNFVLYGQICQNNTFDKTNMLNASNLTLTYEWPTLIIKKYGPHLSGSWFWTTCKPLFVLAFMSYCWCLHKLFQEDLMPPKKSQ